MAANLPEAVMAQIDEMREKAQTQTVQVKFDLDKFTVGNIYDYNAANRTGDFKKIAKVLADVVIECPKAWGEPNKAETYEKLHMTIWKPLCDLFVAVANYSTSKN